MFDHIRNKIADKLEQWYWNSTRNDIHKMWDKIDEMPANEIPDILGELDPDLNSHLL